MCHWDSTIITWYTSSWCAQRSPHIAAETNTTLITKQICWITTGESWSRLAERKDSPLLKGIWLRRGLTFRNWCLCCSCTETEGRSRDRCQYSAPREMTTRTRRRICHLVGFWTDAAPKLTWEKKIWFNLCTKDLKASAQHLILINIILRGSNSRSNLNIYKTSSQPITYSSRLPGKHATPQAHF